MLDKEINKNIIKLPVPVMIGDNAFLLFSHKFIKVLNYAFFSGFYLQYIVMPIVNTFIFLFLSD